MNIEFKPYPFSGKQYPARIPALENGQDARRYPVAIVGGGPVGLSAAFWAGMREVSTRIVDSLPDLGGQLTALYHEKWIYDVPGHPRILARDSWTGIASRRSTRSTCPCIWRPPPRRSAARLDEWIPNSRALG